MTRAAVLHHERVRGPDPRALVLVRAPQLEIRERLQLVAQCLEEDLVEPSPGERVDDLLGARRIEVDEESRAAR